MKNYLLLLTVFSIFVFTACDSEDDNVSLTRSQMLTAKSWKITARTQVTTDSTGNSSTNTSLADCEKDDSYKFTTDNQFTLDEGATKCNSSAPQTQTGTWSLTDNDTKLILTSNGITISGELIEFSNSKMVVKTTIPISGGTRVVTSTFSAQ